MQCESLFIIKKREGKMIKECKDLEYCMLHFYLVLVFLQSDATLFNLEITSRIRMLKLLPFSSVQVCVHTCF